MPAWTRSRLTFLRDEIEPLGMNDSFTANCPEGSFTMTKAEFYRDFANVPRTRAYRNDGFYNYPKIPDHAWKYKRRNAA